jgi:hypothetical protein
MDRAPRASTAAPTGHQTPRMGRRGQEVPSRRRMGRRAWRASATSTPTRAGEPGPQTGRTTPAAPTRGLPGLRTDRRALAAGSAPQTDPPRPEAMLGRGPGPQKDRRAPAGASVAAPVRQTDQPWGPQRGATGSRVPALTVETGSWGRRGRRDGVPPSPTKALRRGRRRWAATTVPAVPRKRGPGWPSGEHPGEPVGEAAWPPSSGAALPPPTTPDRRAGPAKHLQDRRETRGCTCCSASARGLQPVCRRRP